MGTGTGRQMRRQSVCGAGSDTEDDPPTVTIHGCAVALDRKGLLILGASGTGKSSLALTLMAFGARLVADDRTVLTSCEDGLWAASPKGILGRIEARGIGILAAEPQLRARVTAVVDLDQSETERLPPERRVTFLGQSVPLILNGAGLPFAAGLIQYLKGTRTQ